MRIHGAGYVTTAQLKMDDICYVRVNKRHAGAYGHVGTSFIKM